VLLQFLTQFLFYSHFSTIVMPPGPVSCIGGTKYPHCIVLLGCPSHLVIPHVMVPFDC